MNHPLRNFQRGPTWSSNNDPLVASNRIMDDLQFLPGIRMKSIVDRDSGTIGILECCSITTETPPDEMQNHPVTCKIEFLDTTRVISGGPPVVPIFSPIPRPLLCALLKCHQESMGL